MLFTLIVERYEPRSLGITSNLVFSDWEKVFANPMPTTAAVNRILHHWVIMEFDLPAIKPMRPRNGRRSRCRTGKNS